MPTFTLPLADLLGYATVFATVLLAYGRVRSELRHLDDTKSERRELNLLSEDIRGRLEDLRTSMTRLEVSVRAHLTVPPQHPFDPPPGGDPLGDG